MHFLTQLTHVFRHPRVQSRKQNKKGASVYKMYSQQQFFFLHFFLKLVLWSNWPLFHKSESTFQTVFPKQFSFFSSLNSRMSINICKLHQQVCNSQNLLHVSKFFLYFLFSKKLKKQFRIFYTILRLDYQNRVFF